MAQPLLSIGMIVKNEERCLEKCLKALEPLRQAIPCELVIADTGSTDKTKEIATKYADILFDFVWVNDFSAARNAVMDKCTGKWYLTLDADEYLIPNIDELVNFLANKSLTNIKQAAIIIRNHFSKTMDGAYSEFNAVRMCRLDTKIRYTGSIHEYFNQPISCEEIHILSNTIFDHDGYAYISKEHKEKKERRNLELLEKNLENNPDELRVILQCLESSSANPEKRRYFTKYAIEKLRSANTDDKFWKAYAEIIAKQVAMYLNYDCDPLQKEWFEWTFKTFPTSEHITIDTNYIYTKHLFIKGNYSEATKAGKTYLKASDNRRKNNTATLEKLVGYLLYIHEFNKNEIKTLVANSLIKEHDEKEALNLLIETPLYKQNNTVINNWFSCLFEIEKNNNVTEQISKHIASTLNKYADETHSSYDYILAKISALFQINLEKEQYKLFENVPGTIGLCVKIADAKTKDNAEKLLKEVDNWNEFMPLALKNVIFLKAELPKEFYIASPSRLEFLITSLSKSVKDIIDELFEYFYNIEVTADFPYISFVFKLLLNILLNNNEFLPDKTKTVLINKFIEVANVYLSSCYNPALLENEKEILCIPVHHLFSWYLTKADTSYKSENPLEYIKTLRTLLKRIPESKPIVEFLIDNFQKEEEVKKQEMIKNASPELVALAEQLKTMLSAFPENSPELLAIKQSPMYKQVAFLIEN